MNSLVILFQIHAIATLVSTFLPAFFPPCHKYQEIGSLFIPTANNATFMIVSPDGLISCMANCDRCQDRIHFPTVKLGVEIKCPFTPISNKKILPVHYHPPYYNCCQILSQQIAMETAMSLFVSCSTESVAVMLIDHKNTTWQKAFQLACKLYNVPNPSRPSVLDIQVPELKQLLKDYCEDVELVAELPIVHGHDSGHNLIDPMSDKVYRRVQQRDLPAESIFRIEDINNKIVELCTRSIQLTENAYQLERRRASEVLLFVATDSDRTFDKDRPSSIPIAYALKGKSIRISTGRKMINAVREKLNNNGTSVLCEAVDGQWSGLVFRSENGKPLTLFELQRDTWNKFRNMSKDKLLQFLLNMSNVSEEEIAYCYTIDKDNFGVHTMDNIEVEILAVRRPGGNVHRSIVVTSFAGDYNCKDCWLKLQTPTKLCRPDLWNIPIGISQNLLEYIGINPLQERDEPSRDLHTSESEADEVDNGKKLPVNFISTYTQIKCTFAKVHKSTL